MSDRRSPVGDCVENVEQTARILLFHHRELERWEGWAAPDSFPSGSGGGRPTNEVDDDGTPIPQHSDPTATAAVQRENAHANPARAARKLIEKNLYRARTLLDEALSAAKNVKDPEPKQREDANDRDVWCTNHRTIKVDEPVRADAPDSGLCRWCSDWKHAAETIRQTDKGWPLLPPANVMERRARGDRITNRVLGECFGRRIVA